ncbi:MAG: hypothetical protein QM673_00535 [Gordonia sp. (in: high G+C Gram-positive bacteria)]
MSKPQIFDDPTSILFEHSRVCIPTTQEKQYIDGYASFGWEVVGIPRAQGVRGQHTEILFRRDRDTPNRKALDELQSQYETTLAEADRIDNGRSRTPLVVAVVAGLIGSALMAGSVFALDDGLTLLSVMLGGNAIGIWLIGYLRHRRATKSVAARAAQEAPAIYAKASDIAARADRLRLGR